MTTDQLKARIEELKKELSISGGISRCGPPCDEQTALEYDLAALEAVKESQEKIREKRRVMDIPFPPCFVCGTALEPEFLPSGPLGNPCGATDFQATGNFGSTVFDPGSDNEKLHINICDACLIEKASRVLRYRVHGVACRTYDIGRWIPNEANAGTG